MLSRLVARNPSTTLIQQILLSQQQHTRVLSPKTSCLPTRFLSSSNSIAIVPFRQFASLQRQPTVYSNQSSPSSPSDVNNVDYPQEYARKAPYFIAFVAGALVVLYISQILSPEQSLRDGVAEILKADLEVQKALGVPIKARQLPTSGRSSRVLVWGHSQDLEVNKTEGNTKFLDIILEGSLGKGHGFVKIEKTPNGWRWHSARVYVVETGVWITVVPPSVAMTRASFWSDSSSTTRSITQTEGAKQSPSASSSSTSS